jgi:glycosyltransferase involved in cell wall biosynthesis
MTGTNSPNRATLSVILPAKNEAGNLAALLPGLTGTLESNIEIIVVDDGSTDETATISRSYGARVITHPYSMGNGAAIKTGARAASNELLVFMDADGQHDPQYIPELVERLREGYDMVVGAREADTQASFWRGFANRFYNKLASWVTGHKVMDLTSGFRVARADKFRKFVYLLPNGFSYPTTITMAFFRAGHPIAYIPIRAKQRQGKSHIRPLRDGLRFLLIIFRIGTLYSPLKFFVPTSMLFFLAGIFYYLYTYWTSGRFTNMSALLFITSILVFLMGLISEQISNLLYTESSRNGAESTED